MPLPPLRKNSSPTTAPITDSPAAMRKPVKIAGIAAGQLQLAQPRTSAMRRLSVNRSCWLASAESRPNSVFDTIGKIEMITQTRIREPNPKPKMLPMSGTMARIGMAWAAIRYGQNERSTHVAWAITTAIEHARGRWRWPARSAATTAVQPSAWSMSPRTAASRNELVDHRGRRRAGGSSACRRRARSPTRASGTTGR